MGPQPNTRGLCRELVRHHLGALSSDLQVNHYDAGIYVAIVNAFRGAYGVEFDQAELIMWTVRDEIQKEGQ